MTVTNPDGRVFTRTGNRVREFSAGYDTDTIEDNVFLITGSWTTTNPNGVAHTNTISDASPLRIIFSCNQPIVGQHRYEIVSGMITVVKNNNTAVIDYGDGTCDNTGTITINGGSPITFTLRN